MTPQERQLVDELFDRLAQLENAPRDSDAERAVADGLRRAPHAAYALVQTALVQDEALKRADARIQELEGRGQPPHEQPRGFLDNMRDTLFGREEPRQCQDDEHVQHILPRVARPVVTYGLSEKADVRATDIRQVGLGELLARLEQLKRLLAAEGLFATDRKRVLPFLPRRIGLITGRASAAAALTTRLSRPVGTISASWPVTFTLVRSAARTVTSSYSDSAWNTVTRSW